MRQFFRSFVRPPVSKMEFDNESRIRLVLEESLFHRFSFSTSNALMS